MKSRHLRWIDIRHELASKVELEFLLKRNRPQHLEKKVKAIANSNIDIFEKIDKIRQLDYKYEMSKKNYNKLNINIPIEYSKRDDNDTNIQREIKKKRLAKIINPTFPRLGIRKLSLIKYMLFEFNRIKWFAKSTGLINMHSGFIPHPSRLATDYIISELPKILIPFSTIIKAIYLEGWKYLSAIEYNLIVYLYRSVQKYLLMKNFLRDMVDDDSERLFLVILYIFDGLLKCCTTAECYEYIHRAFEKGLKMFPSFIKYKSFVFSSIERLFYYMPDKVSLINIILALYMCAYRRYTSLGEILKLAHVKPPKTDKFELDDNVSLYFNRYTDEKIREYRELKVLSKALRGINLSGGTDDYSRFSSLLRVIFKNKNIGFDEFKSKFDKNIVHTLKAFLESFVATYYRLFCDKISVIEKDKNILEVYIFGRDVFKDIFEDIIKDINQLDKYIRELKAVKLSIEHYQAITEGENIVASELEIEVANFIKSIGDKIYKLWRAILCILGMHYKIFESSDDVIKIAISQKDKPINDITSVPRIIPFYDAITNIYGSHRKLINIIEDSGFLLFNILHLLKYKGISKTYLNDNYYAKKIEQIESELKRLGVDYKEI